MLYVLTFLAGVVVGAVGLFVGGYVWLMSQILKGD